jgi:LrgB-like family
VAIFWSGFAVDRLYRPFSAAEVTYDSGFDGGFGNHPGVPALLAVFAILGGIIAALFLIPMLRLLWVHDPAAAVLAAGTAGSGIVELTMVPLGLLLAAFAGVVK